MADDNRYGGYGSGGSYGRDDYRSDRDRGGGFGAYGQGSYNQGSGQQDYRSDRSSGWDDDRSQNREGRDNVRYGNQDENRSVPIDETDRLIASNKVEGTAVYDRRGNRLGSVYNFMVDKRSGRAAYAVLSFGGFMGLGARHFPLPWNQLTYDERYGGYVVDITERDLDRAPSHRAGDDARFDQRYSSAIDRYYGTVRY